MAITAPESVGSTAQRVQYLFSQLAGYGELHEKDREPVIHISFSGPLNLAITIQDAIRLRDSLNRQLPD